MNAPIATDENELLIKLRNGDQHAYITLYNLYKMRLAANFIKLLRDDELAKDALQDLFMRVWAGRQNIDPGQSFRSYLFRIAENLTIDYYRKAARERAYQEKMLIADNQWYRHVEEQMLSKENIALVRAIIEKLPEQQRKVYTMHKIDGNSYKEISELLGISLSTINKHVHFAHKFVKAQLLSSPLQVGTLAAIILLS